MTTKVEELREQLNEHIVEFGATLAGDIVDDIDSLIAAAKEEERERIRSRGVFFEPLGSDKEATYVICASVLSPAPIQKVRGEPSQALLDELSEICGDKVTYEPVSPAPKETTLDKAGVILRGQHGVDW
jgi:hypothetical protein